MTKSTILATKMGSRSVQMLVCSLFGTMLFIWVSSSQLNEFVSAYLILLVAQAGTLGLYLLMRRLKTKDRQPRSSSTILIHGGDRE